MMAERLCSEISGSTDCDVDAPQDLIDPDDGEVSGDDDSGPVKRRKHKSGRVAKQLGQDASRRHLRRADSRRNGINHQKSTPSCDIALAENAQCNALAVATPSPAAPTSSEVFGSNARPFTPFSAAGQLDILTPPYSRPWEESPPCGTRSEAGRRVNKPTRSYLSAREQAKRTATAGVQVRKARLGSVMSRRRVASLQSELQIAALQIELQAQEIRALKAERQLEEANERAKKLE